MSRRLTVMAAAGRLVARTPARRVLSSELVRRVRLRAGREVTADRALRVVQSLESAGVDYWLAGGWGVDALAGRQTRPHVDLDVVVDAADGAIRDRATAALAAAGLRPSGVETSIAPLPMIWVFSDRAGTVVDLLPADFGAAPFDRPGARTTGVIAGRPVACVSADIQLSLRAGYRHRPADRSDLEVLGTLPRSHPAP